MAAAVNLETKLSVKNDFNNKEVFSNSFVNDKSNVCDNKTLHNKISETEKQLNKNKKSAVLDEVSKLNQSVKAADTSCENDSKSDFQEKENVKKEENCFDVLTTNRSFDMANKSNPNILADLGNQPKVMLVQLELNKNDESVILSKNEKVKSENVESSDDLKQVLTESILNEEQELHRANEIKSDELKQLALEKWQEVSIDVKLSQLNHLLEKSSIYANYLLNVIEVSRKKEEKKARKKKKMTQMSKSEPTSKSKTKKRKQSGPTHSSKKLKIDDDCKHESSFHIGQKVVFESCKDDEEELLEGKILDKVFQNEVWKYFLKRGRSQFWINESKIFKDLSEKDEIQNSTNNTSNSSTTKGKVVDEKSLLEAKLHRGRAVQPDDSKSLNGQDFPSSQPDLLTGGILRSYQITGYQWLKVLFDNAVNGILADEMGLGKTIQSIAMICRLIRTGFRGPFLVCAPLSTICNWILEFKKFAPQVPVLLYHGNASERLVLLEWIGKPISSLECMPVVVTSYEVLMRDRPSLAKFSWDYLIIDEGHRLKNINCRLLKELKALTVTAKVLLTGTPLQNNLGELWSLLNFLLPEVFNDLNTFEAWFDLNELQKGAKAVSTKKEQDIILTLHKILAPFLLRRTKGDIDLELPPKRELLVFVPLTDNQASFYQAIADRTIRKVLYKQESNEQSVDFAQLCKVSDDFLQENSTGKLTRSATLSARLSMEKRNAYNDDESDINVSLNNLMMQMRKCCNHPYLIKFPLIPGTDFYRVDNEIITSCGKMRILDQMLPILLKDKHKVLIFSQMTKILDILEDYCRFKSFSYFRLDGSTKCDDRQKYIEQYNNDPSTFIFLLSTKAGGLGINLAAADTVIIYDSDWNPQNDLQAQDRCHRIGQTRPVIVYRLVAANTVDQFMVQRAEAKRVLERLIINRTKFKGQLDEDLKSEASNVVASTTLLSMLQKFGTGSHSSKKPISDEELHKILDRQYVMKCSDNDLTCGVFQNIE